MLTINETGKTTHHASPSSVLVVDDEETVALVLKRGLSHAGFRVQTAFSSKDALHLLESFRFDALLCDICMPGMQGDALQRLARQRQPDLAVLLLTALPDVNHAVDCLKEGVHDYVTKPFQIDDVADRLTQALERREQSLKQQRRESRHYQEEAMDSPLPDAYATLTAREREVMLLAAEGLTNSGIGARLFISPRTVEIHRTRLMRKLTLQTQTELVRLALRWGLLAL